MINIVLENVTISTCIPGQMDIYGTFTFTLTSHVDLSFIGIPFIGVKLKYWYDKIRNHLCE